MRPFPLDIVKLNIQAVKFIPAGQEFSVVGMCFYGSGVFRRKALRGSGVFRHE